MIIEIPDEDQPSRDIYPTTPTNMKQGTYQTAIDHLEAEKETLLHNAMITYAGGNDSTGCKLLVEAYDLHYAIEALRSLTPHTDHANPPPA